ncbi:MAG: hypothetical protein NC820_01055 [Candidatus Omnitrophica bacterium]|nr:hypothetical protein [Candidatus Omnitrophota bacterium]
MKNLILRIYKLLQESTEYTLSLQGLELPTDKISADFFVHFGFEHQKNYYESNIK